MIHTKVARVLDATQVVLAAGEIDGVKEGMVFIIYDLSDSILDPETGEDLGRIELVKGTVIAQHVQDKMTIASTRSRKVERTINPFAAMTALVERKVVESVQDQLNVEGAKSLKADLTVRVGDNVRSVNKSSLSLMAS